jgi:ribosomal protein L3 glutamine methyltransferase
MRLARLVDELAAALDGAGLQFGHGTDNARDEAIWLVLHAAGLDTGGDDIDWTADLSPDQVDAARDLARQRCRTRRPLAYLIGEAWFAGERFFVDERAIVPRSHLGEWIADRFEPFVDPARVHHALDMCTGSGCIAVALALAWPDALVDAVDISAGSLEVAAVNVDRHRVGERVRLLQGDLFTPVAGRRYDLIVCNPPYVADGIVAALPDEHRAEPRIAFAAGGQGLDLIERLLAHAGQHLERGGHLVVEAGSARPAVESRWPSAPFTWLASASGEEVVFLLSAEELSSFS